MKIQTCITTFERAEALLLLLHDLEREGAQRVRVYDDCSPSDDYSQCIELIARNGWMWQRAARNHGRIGYPRLLEWMWQDLAGEASADLYVFLEDDIRLCSRFFVRLVDTWQSIDSSSKGAMMLLTDTRDAIWEARRGPEALGTVDRIDWVDTKYAASARTLHDLHFKFPVVPLRPAGSSGAGIGLTNALRRLDRTMYRANPSLVAHVPFPSRMHPKERLENPLYSKNFVDGEERHEQLLRAELVTATLASIPSRVEMLSQVVAAILPQVDELTVWLNGYSSVPTFLQHPGIRVLSGCDLGDAGKFYGCARARGYRLALDDDIAYPPDYVKTLIAWIERLERRAVVGVHGRCIVDREAGYRRGSRVFHFEHELNESTQVHVLGTGTIAYHASTLRLQQQDFRVPNVADLWFARAALAQGVPLFAIPREKRWLTDLSSNADGIYERNLEIADQLTRETVWSLPGSDDAHGDSTDTP